MHDDRAAKPSQQWNEEERRVAREHAPTARPFAETIDLVAVLAGRGSRRGLAELARVDGLGPDGDYRVTLLEPVSPQPEEGRSS